MMKPFLFSLILLLMVSCSPSVQTLTILHTNDTHSQVEPKSNGTGGYARRMGIINEERAADSDLLLLDAGDFSQGTPYFNFFNGRIEVDAMNTMGYDAGTLGNHEFDNGLDTLAMVIRRAHFPIVCANYDFSNTPLDGLVPPYTILRRKGCKIGVFGMGVAPGSLIAAKNFAPITYIEPYGVAQRVATELREKHHCDVVICLSHQGTYPGAEGDASDVEMVQQTRDIDLVIGGHTHVVYDTLRVANLDGRLIPVVQAGKAGANIGKISLQVSLSWH